MNMYNVPSQFLLKTNLEYPPGNKFIFEEYFYNKFLEQNPNTNRIYLPIQWTSFYLETRVNENAKIEDLQFYLNSIPSDKKYFTVVQYDDGIINNISHLDLYKFASGGVGDYAIPLNCSSYTKTETKKEIFASFVGTIKGRHKVREKMQEYTKNLKNYFISETVSFESFKDIMEMSIFSLCPRGYGKTSFRINESLNLGSIPVYIYDDPWIPFNDEIDFSKYGVLIHESDLHNIDNILMSYSQTQIKDLREYGNYIYNNYYIYDSCYNRILNKEFVKC